jgi:hypothetical protein
MRLSAAGRGIYAGWGAPRFRRSALAQYPADALVGYLIVAVNAVGVDAQEHIDGMTRPPGHCRRRDASVEPERHGRVPQVVRRASQRGPGLLRNERQIRISPLGSLIPAGAWPSSRQR